MVIRNDDRGHLVIKYLNLIAVFCIAVLTTACQQMPVSQQVATHTLEPKVTTTIAVKEIKKSVKKHKALVRAIAGIRFSPDPLDDREVVKMYGRGLFTDQEGHVGGRYYTDSKRTITLHSEIGCDNNIDMVELFQGIHVPKELKASDAGFISSALSASPDIDHGLNLGMSAHEVIEKLGLPDKDQKHGNRRIITYEVTSEEDTRVSLCYQADYVFANDQLVSISAYDGE